MAVRFGALREAVPLALRDRIAERLRAAVAATAATPTDSIELCAIDPAGGGLRRAILAGEIDIAVLRCDSHPSVESAELALAAIPLRDEPWEAWASARFPDLVDLPEGARVAAGSALRRAQILHFRPDLEIAPLSGGSADPLDESDARGDAGIILAAADLRRVGHAGRIRAIFSASELTPAPGQGALALVVRAEDERSAAIARGIDDPGSRAEIAAERAFLAALGIEGDLPAGAIARRQGGMTTLVGVVATPDGERLLRLGTEGALADPRALGERLAAIVLRSGGREIVEHLRTLALRGAAP